MFHVNAWGIPHAAPMTGAKLVFPGCGMDGASLYELVESEKVESSAGVPTVWLGLIAHMKERGLKFSTLKSATIGGAAVPPAMVRTLEEDFGLKVLHGWGMTEMSPSARSTPRRRSTGRCRPKTGFALSLKQGRPLPGVEMKIVDAEGVELPWDGKAAGNLLVRGPWVLREYFRGEGGNPLTADGWLPTGDVGTIDPTAICRSPTARRT
jgi:fatty-acyl-CoA synthase